MRRKILLLSMLMALPIYAADEQTTLTEKQAILTRQASVLDKVSDVYGKYVVIRDKYIRGSEGLEKLSPTFFKSVDAWSAKWIEVLALLEKEDWVKTLASDTLVKKIEAQKISLVALENSYARLKSSAWHGYSMTRDLPRLNFSEFQRLKNPEYADALVLQYYADHILKLNENMDQLQNVFAASYDALGGDKSKGIIGECSAFTQDLEQRLQLLTKLSKLSYPELKAALESVQSTLIAMEVLNPITARAADVYKKGLDAVRSLDISEAETQLESLKRFRDQSFVAFEKNKTYDPERVKQAKSLVDLNARDLKLAIDTRIGSVGGKEAALRQYIDERSRSAIPFSPVDFCKDTPDGPNKYRSLFDCNLYRRGVHPFLNHLDEIEYAMLKIIEKNIKQVYKGPLQEKEAAK